MDTFINLSGGIRSAYALIRWLKKHQGNILIHYVYFGGKDRADTLREMAVFQILEYVRAKYPQRTEFAKAGFLCMHPENTLTKDEVMTFSTAALLRNPKYAELKHMVSTSPASYLPAVNKMADKKVKEIMESGDLRDALIELPPDLVRTLYVCDHGNGHMCGVCTACAEIIAARKPLE